MSAPTEPGAERVEATADLYAQAKAAIAGKRAVLGAGTDRPWAVIDERAIDFPITGPGGLNLVGNAGVSEDGDLLASDFTEWDLGCAEADVRLIVAAVNDYGLLLDALDVVLERHLNITPRGHWCKNGVGKAWYHSDEPCPDAQAVLTALGVTS